jgi:ABC-type Na+ transport system ATPase subunit NatA
LSRNRILVVEDDPAISDGIAVNLLYSGYDHVLFRDGNEAAQAIMKNPCLLILDEPFNGLDKQGVREMRELIKGLMTEGKTIILTSHIQGDIDDLFDTVCEIDAGVLTVLREERYGKMRRKKKCSQ